MFRFAVPSSTMTVLWKYISRGSMTASLGSPVTFSWALGYVESRTIYDLEIPLLIQPTSSLVPRTS
jgi:hypothetical protein